MSDINLNSFVTSLTIARKHVNTIKSIVRGKRARYRFGLLASLLVIAVTGCTSTRVVEEKDAIIGEQTERLAVCESDLAQAQKDIAVLKMEHEQALEKDQSDLLRCQEKLEHQVEVDQQLLTREKALLNKEKELRERLAMDLEQKNIEIENLKGRLSVKVLDNILFKSGSVEILPKGREVLSRIAASLADAKDNLRIEGHTDDVLIGPVLAQRIPSNWELSVLRAASVVRYLEANNIESTRLSASGFSKFRPKAPNSNAASRQKNRRVEIVVVP